jgi:hypothetical protein
MASLPSLEEAERAILDIFEDQGTRPGESIRSLVVSNRLLAGDERRFRHEDLVAALESMQAKGWITVKSDMFYMLTEAGFAQV